MAQENKNIPAKQINPAEIPFKGYTMEEIKYHRAMLALRKEFCKAKLMQTIDGIYPKKKDKISENSKFRIASSIASKIFSNLNTLDYVMMGVSLFGTIKKGIRLIKKKK